MKLGVVLYLLVCFTGSLWLMGLIKSGMLVEIAGVRVADTETYLYCGLAGAVGGCLYAMRLFHDFYDKLTGRWVLWYLMRPIKCAGAAVMTVVLFESGIMLLQPTNSLEAKIGIAFLVGFGYGKVMDKLKALTETLFNGKNEPSPPVGGDDTPRAK